LDSFTLTPELIKMSKPSSKALLVSESNPNPHDEDSETTCTPTAAAASAVLRMLNRPDFTQVKNPSADDGKERGKDDSKILKSSGVQCHKCHK